MIQYFTELSLLVQCIIAFVLPFACFLLAGSKFIAILRAMKAGQPIRQASKCQLAPEHQSKVGTPTMGGLMLIGLVIICTLLLADLSHSFIQCALFVTLVTAFLGFLDDYAKITRHSTDGVSGWFKIGLQFIAALGCSVYLYYKEPGVTNVLVPFYGWVDIGIYYIPLALLVIIGSSNAVNLTDGLDGLASGCMIITSLAFLLLCSNSVFAPFLVAIISSCMGFLWFNCHPAKVFMGDTGSLALGGALGTVAVCTCSELLLIIIGGIFVAEALSVMIQVMWFKYTRKRYGEGRRVFRMAPIHHHFEKGGLSETQVCVRFWLVAIILAFVGIHLVATV